MLGPNKINAHFVKTLKERAACHSHELHIKCAKREGSNWVNFGRPWRPMAATCSQFSLVKLTELSFYLGPKTMRHDDRHKWRETFKTRQIPLKAFEISSTMSVQWRDPSIQSAEKKMPFQCLTSLTFARYKDCTMTRSSQLPNNQSEYNEASTKITRQTHSCHLYKMSLVLSLWTNLL